MLDVVRKEAGGCGVTSEVEADWRGLADYLVKFQTQGVLKLTVRELDIRTAEEFSALDLKIRLKFPVQIARRSRASRDILN